LNGLAFMDDKFWIDGRIDIAPRPLDGASFFREA
jgi:hypothetical protein